MKLNELKRVIDIDNAIKQTQQDLSELYVQRARLMKQAEQSPKDKLPSENSSELIALALYKELEATWAKYDITLPSFRMLKRRLVASSDVMRDLEADLPEVAGQFKVILLPPARQLSLPIAANIRGIQQRKKRQRVSKLAEADTMEEVLTKGMRRRTWGVMVVLASPEGLHRGQPMKILNDRSYMVGGHDARQLGVAEYAAMTLSIEGHIDGQTNTMLLSTFSAHLPVPYVRFTSAHYQFELDTIGLSGIFSDDRFRPAVEVL